MKSQIAIRIPQPDKNDLAQLVQDMGGSEEEIQTTNALDGEGVVQAIILLTGATYPFVRAWLQHRLATRKNFSIVHGGTELRGYTADEAAMVIEKLDKMHGALEPTE